MIFLTRPVPKRRNVSRGTTERKGVRMIFLTRPVPKRRNVSRGTNNDAVQTKCTWGLDLIGLSSPSPERERAVNDNLTKTNHLNPHNPRSRRRKGIRMIFLAQGQSRHSTHCPASRQPAPSSDGTGKLAIWPVNGEKMSHNSAVSRKSPKSRRRNGGNWYNDKTQLVGKVIWEVPDQYALNVVCSLQCRAP